MVLQPDLPRPERLTPRDAAAKVGGAIKAFFFSCLQPPSSTVPDDLTDFQRGDASLICYCQAVN